MKKNSCCLVLLLFALFSAYFSHSQNVDESTILFYNVENLFDLQDNPDAKDEEFLQGGARGWTSKKLNLKLKRISKVILSVVGWNIPDVVGLAEIENQYILEKLLRDTPLKNYSYGIIHKESPDRRGIDLGVLYNEKTFYPLKYEMLPLMLNDSTPMPTREIVYVNGVLHGKDTVHILFNHWPSRYSGVLETYGKRKLAAETLRSKIQEINRTHKNSHIIVMGDFNDQPADDSILKTLMAKSVSDTIESKLLYNLSYNWLQNDMGTLKFQSQWFVFDQVMVSGNLLQKQNFGVDTAYPVKLPFLLQKDKKYGGKKPFRTYSGFRNNGGFSDHLPILIRFTKEF